MRSRQISAFLDTGNTPARARDDGADRARIAAALAGPPRRRMDVATADAGHLPLFVAANEPGLL